MKTIYQVLLLFLIIFSGNCDNQRITPNNVEVDDTLAVEDTSCVLCDSAELNYDELIYSLGNYIIGPNDSLRIIGLSAAGDTVLDTLMDSANVHFEMGIDNGTYSFILKAPGYLTDASFKDINAMDNSCCVLRTAMIYNDSCPVLDWDTFTITAYGIGFANPKDPIAVQRAGAMRVAKQMLLCDFLAQFKELHYSPEHTFNELFLNYENIRTNMLTYVNSIAISDTGFSYWSDGSVTITQAIPVTGPGTITRKMLD